MSIRLLDRYVWRQLGELFTFGVGIFTLLLLVNHLFLVARLVLQQGAALSVALQLLIYRLPYFLAFSFPMAMLLASLLAIGRLSDSQEITAMRTSGISLARIGASVTAAGILAAGWTAADPRSDRASPAGSVGDEHSRTPAIHHRPAAQRHQRRSLHCPGALQAGRPHVGGVVCTAGGARRVAAPPVGHVDWIGTHHSGAHRLLHHQFGDDHAGG